MGVLDEAFMSRIHVSLFFKDLTVADRKKIWTDNIKRLEKTKIKITDDARESLTSDELIEQNWNGREIRNGKFQTCQVAEFSAYIVKHFKLSLRLQRQTAMGNPKKFPRLQPFISTKWSESLRISRTTSTNCTNTSNSTSWQVGKASEQI
jgi:hypothetical protein